MVGDVCVLLVLSERIPRRVAFSRALCKSRKEINFFFPLCTSCARIFITHLVLSSEQHLDSLSATIERIGLSRGD